MGCTGTKWVLSAMPMSAYRTIFHELRRMMGVKFRTRITKKRGARNRFLGAVIIVIAAQHDIPHRNHYRGYFVSFTKTPEGRSVGGLSPPSLLICLISSNRPSVHWQEFWLPLLFMLEVLQRKFQSQEFCLFPFTFYRPHHMPGAFCFHRTVNGRLPARDDGTSASSVSNMCFIIRFSHGSLVSAFLSYELVLIALFIMHAAKPWMASKQASLTFR